MKVVHILLQDFAENLASQNASDSTVKNYLADIGLFFRFLENRDQPVSLLTLPHQLSNLNISSYHQYLIANFPIATVKRRISSLNKFISFINSSRPVSELPARNVPSPLPPPPHAKAHFNYPLALFILLTISLSIIGGLVVSQLTPKAPVGLVDPGVSHVFP